jgi:hypothetical protein
MVDEFTPPAAGAAAATLVFARVQPSSHPFLLSVTVRLSHTKSFVIAEHIVAHNIYALYMCSVCISKQLEGT